MKRADVHRIIEETAKRWYRRRLFEVLAPSAPPALALAVAALVGRLPLEIAAAAAIAFVLLASYASGLSVAARDAAGFLDRSLGAKDHFLTLATVGGHATLLPLVESSASAILEASGPPRLPPPRKRPLVTSVVLSIAGFLLLWLIPELAPLASTEGGGLDRIAAELAQSSDAGDQELARVLREVSRTLHDPQPSREEKQAKIEQALAKLDETRPKRPQVAAGRSGGGGEEQNQGEQSGAGGNEKGRGQGQQAGGTGSARGQARQELEKLAGELAGESREGKGEQGKQSKPTPSGGGIQGPETSAKERKAGDREGTGNQPGKAPDKSGGNEKPGGAEGQVKAEQGSERPPEAADSKSKGAGSGGEGAGQRSSQQADNKPAERYYKPGEGPGGSVAGGQYVRIRVPDASQPLPGTEVVAKPGEINLEVPYGNAPLPEAGSPGEVPAEQPVPLEYRDALKP